MREAKFYVSHVSIGAKRLQFIGDRACTECRRTLIMADCWESNRRWDNVFVIGSAPVNFSHILTHRVGYVRHEMEFIFAKHFHLFLL